MRNQAPAVWAMAIAIATLGSSNCAKDPVYEPDASTDTDTDTDADTDSDQDALDEFFSLAQIHDLEIHLEPDSWDALVIEPKIYVHGSVTIDGQLFEDVGIRLKGSIGSFIPLDETEPQEWSLTVPGKSAFIVDFNRWVVGQSFHGLKKLTVNNNRQDVPGIKQYLGYALFRAGDVPASRAGFARVTLNGDDRFLYTLVESPDNGEFLRSWYGSNDGNLYEGEGSDFEGESFEGFDQDHGDDLSKDDLAQMAAALDAIDNGDQVMPVLEQFFNVDEMMTYLATELYLAHWDGYAWSTNNFMVHHDTIADEWTLVPWGIDQLFDDELLGAHGGIMKSPGPSWDPPAFGLDSMFNGGRIPELCLTSSECMASLHAAFLDVLDRVEAIDLPEIAQEARALAEPVMLEEAYLHGDPGYTIAKGEEVFTYMQHRDDDLLGWLPCLLGEAVDHDGDTHNGCTEDCRDLDENIHPDADETCNYVDDNCNDLIDEAPECPPCHVMTAPDGRTYHLCFQLLSWADAGQWCQDNGMDLASFHDEESSWEVTYAFFEEIGISQSWIGLNDIDSEGTFTWTDGSPLDWEYWLMEIPPEWDEYLDCVSHHVWIGWFPQPCTELYPFICKEPV